MSNNNSETPKPTETINPMDLLEKLTQLTQAITLQQTQMVSMQNAALANPQPTTQLISITEGSIHTNPIDEKMDGTNYTFWCQAVEMYVKGRERMKHLTWVPPPPDEAHPSFRKWEVDDAVVKGWLINSLEPRLRSKYIRHPTLRDVWQALATTYYDGSDEAQVFVLNQRVSRVKQDGKTVEEFYDELQSLWQEIDFRSPNPMVCACDIEKFNNFIQKTRVYTFLDGLDDRHDNIRAQVLQMSHFPSLEQAFAHVRRESNRQGIMIKGGQEMANSVAMATRGYRSREVNYSTDKALNFKDKSKLKCTHCGGTRHVRDQCFELVGYPDWWKNMKKRQPNDKGRARMVAAAGENKAADMTNFVESSSSKVGEGLKLATSSLVAATSNTSNVLANSSGQGSPHERDNWPWY